MFRMPTYCLPCHAERDLRGYVAIPVTRSVTYVGHAPRGIS